MMIIKRPHAPFSEAKKTCLYQLTPPYSGGALGASLLSWHRLLLVEAPSCTRAHLHPMRTRGAASIADTGTGASFDPRPLT